MDKFPVISREEFKKRREVFRKKLIEEGMDLIIVCSNDRATAGPANVRYLTDFSTHFEPSCCLVPAEGEPALVVGPESEALAKLNAKIDKFIVAQEFSHPEEDYPFAKLISFTDIIADMKGRNGKTIKKVGIIGKELLDINLYLILSDHYELVIADSIMNEARAVKSPDEMKVIQYAYKIAEAGLRVAVDTIKPGMLEVEVAAEIEYAMRKMGSEGTGIDTMVAAGLNSNPIIARSTLGEIENNDFILLTIVPRYQGYHAALGRPVSLGKPDKEILEAVNIGVKAQQVIMDNIRPGILGREVEIKGRKVMKEKGLEDYFAYIGLHSLGLIEFEPPIFFSQSDVQIQPDMVLSVDIPCFLTPWQWGFRLEDGVRVTESGCKLLDLYPRGLIEL